MWSGLDITFGVWDEGTLKFCSYPNPFSSYAWSQLRKTCIHTHHTLFTSHACNTNTILKTKTKKREKKESKKKKKNEREDSSCDQQQIIQQYEHRLAQQCDNGTRRTFPCTVHSCGFSFNLKGTLAPLIPALKFKGIRKHPVEQTTGCKQQSEGQDMNMICRGSNKCSTDSHS